MIVCRPTTGKFLPWLAILCLGALFFTTGFSPATRRESAQIYRPALLLPDLRTLPPADLRLEADRRSGKKLIRFSNAVWNSGPGKLELRGKLNHSEEFVRVTQIIDREDQGTVSRPAGQFYFHAEHDHVHWVGFSQYQVWSAHTDGQLGRLLAANDKVGYCILDYRLYAQPGTVLNRVARPNPTYSSCSWFRQGLSIGWKDIYKANIPGQVVDISHLPDGLYALKSSADPQNLLREADDRNNSALVYFVLRQESLRVYLPEEFFTDLRPSAFSLRFMQFGWEKGWN